MRVRLRWALCGVGGLLAVAAWGLVSHGRGPAANKLVVAGTVYEWREGGSRPLAGVEVLVLRDGKVLGTATSKDNGTFATDALPEGSPVVVLFRKKGYGEGKVVCCRGDDAEGKVSITLLRDTDAKAMWGDAAEKVFGPFDLRLGK